MGRRIICAAVVLCVLLGLVPPVQALEIPAPSAILMDAATGTVLWENASHEKRAPASVTKVMTLLLVMEALDSGRISWEDTVTASETAAAKGGSQVYLEAGEQMSMDEMLKSVVVSSANDCATALAEHVAGSEAAFVEQMNQRARELGMQDTHFVNCTGLDDDADAAEHLTSAYDIALMSRQLLQHEAIRKYTTIWMDTVRNGQFGLSNTNKLVRFYQGTTGLKTGYTSGAGHCLSASAQRDGMELIAVVLGCGSSTERFESAKMLLDYGFANYALVDVTTQGAGAVPVELGTEAQVAPILSDDTPLLIDKGLQGAVQFRTELAPSVAAPVAQGQELGCLVVLAQEQELARIPLVAAAAVPRQSLWQILARIGRHLCMNGD